MSKQIIKLKLKKELFKNKEGKVVRKDMYAQNDAVSILQILTFYNSLTGSFNEFQTIISLHDKFKNAWREDLRSIDLSIGEASFLKEYLENFNKKSKPLIAIDGTENLNRLTEIRLRTLLSFTKQLS